MGDEVHKNGRWSWLTSASLLLALALVVVRATMLEVLRDPFEITPGSAPVPSGAGPAAGVLLDLAAWLAALGVLARRALDGQYRLRWTWSFVPMLGLGALAVFSTWWASDRYAALVGAMHFCSALVLLWATAQLVRHWWQFRMVAAVAVALLLVMLAHGFMYRFIDVPELRENWARNREQILQQRHWAPDSFPARQFERRVLGGEVFGFTVSPNSFAAQIVMLGFVAAGVVLQRLRDKDQWGWAATTGLLLVLSGWMLWYTQSMTAAVTPVLGGLVLLLVWRLHGWLAAHWKIAFGTGVAAVLAGAAAVIGYGLAAGTLPHASMAFRWMYWRGAADIFRQHPWLGVGWDSFGLHYLAARLPQASEEIRDPHNLLVRFAVELGIVGLILAVAWLARLWWELAGGQTPRELVIPARRTSNVLKPLATVAVIGMGLNILCSIDFAQPAAYVAIEVMKRLLYLCLLVLGSALVAVRAVDDVRPDHRAAPWVLYGLLVGLGLFLLHNTIDFSMFEVGGMYLVALLVGGGLGIRLHREGLETPAQRSYAVAGLVAAALLWMAAGVGLVAPVVAAEQLASRGDRALRLGQFTTAAEQYREAYETASVANADWVARSARALMLGNGAAGEVLERLDRAIADNPRGISYRLSKAQYLLTLGSVQQAADAYAAVVMLNPADVEVRLGYAALLQRLGRGQEAQQQRELAQWYNDQLEPADPKRLPPGAF